MKLYRSHVYFWITAFAFLLYSIFLQNSEETIDINIRDTYFIIANSHVMMLFSVVLLFIGLIYYLHFKFEITQLKLLSKIHTVITISCIVIYLTGSLFLKENDFPLFEETYSLHNFLILIIFIGIIIQPLFAINSIFSLIKHSFKKKN